MDITRPGIHFDTGLLGQTVLTLPNPYRLGEGLLRVYVNNVLQVPSVDYQEVTYVTIEFFAPFVGGEILMIYEDDSSALHLDRGIITDSVVLEVV